MLGLIGIIIKKLRLNFYKHQYFAIDISDIKREARRMEGKVSSIRDINRKFHYIFSEAYCFSLKDHEI